VSLNKEIWFERSRKYKLRKNEKYFVFHRKKAYISMEIIKNLGQKGGTKLKTISFLKDLNTGYLSIHLSQF